MANQNHVMVPISAGELVDKIVILEIKKDRIVDPVRKLNVTNELTMLLETREKNFSRDNDFLIKLNKLEVSLKRVNEELWDLEDRIREYDEKKDFGKGFIETSRSIYATNDKRGLIKKKINMISGSAIFEEKSYKNWK